MNHILDAVNISDNVYVGAFGRHFYPKQLTNEDLPVSLSNVYIVKHKVIKIVQHKVKDYYYYYYYKN